MANRDSGTVSVIESMNNTLVKNITIGSSPEHLLFNPSNKKIYVANVISNTISVIDGDANAVTNEVELGNDPGDFSNWPRGQTINFKI